MALAKLESGESTQHRNKLISAAYQLCISLNLCGSVIGGLLSHHVESGLMIHLWRNNSVIMTGWPKKLISKAKLDARKLEVID